MTLIVQNPLKNSVQQAGATLSHDLAAEVIGIAGQMHLAEVEEATIGSAKPVEPQERIAAIQLINAGKEIGISTEIMFAALDSVEQRVKMEQELLKTRADLKLAPNATQDEVASELRLRNFVDNLSDQFESVIQLITKSGATKVGVSDGSLTTNEVVMQSIQINGVPYVRERDTWPTLKRILLFWKPNDDVSKINSPSLKELYQKVSGYGFGLEFVLYDYSRLMIEISSTPGIRAWHCNYWNS